MEPTQSPSETEVHSGEDGDGYGGGEYSSENDEAGVTGGIGETRCDPDVIVLVTGICQEVKEIISFLEPEVVFVELCASRVFILLPQTMKIPTMSDMIESWKQKQNTFGILYGWFLAKASFANHQLEVFPGTEFCVAYEEALKYGGSVILGDCPVQITLKRTWAKMTLWHKVKFIYSLMFQAVFLPSSEELDRMESPDLVHSPEQLGHQHSHQLWNRQCPGEGFTAGMVLFGTRTPGSPNPANQNKPLVSKTIKNGNKPNQKPQLFEEETPLKSFPAILGIPINGSTRRLKPRCEDEQIHKLLRTGCVHVTKNRKSKRFH
ncbi:unnamed protein product [Eruca vesicaria subsp. sativa]|uniref:Uncharacterized protein n=1 Tax=Eruca vesicaria subsp. sativa TaxID=29727 RepID=A0ABC8LLV7_ERUVS|nr:unnamed protein product [Eruca vesicaria subsp. sativa]